MPAARGLSRRAIAERYRGGQTYDEIAAALACSVSGVRYHVDKAGLVRRGKPGRKPWPPGQPPRWSRLINSYGYPYYYSKAAGRVTIIMEHRLLMEKTLGRSLMKHEQVHHKNGVRDDNRLSNLELRLGPHGNGATHCRHCGKPL